MLGDASLHGYSLGVARTDPDELAHICRYRERWRFREGNKIRREKIRAVSHCVTDKFPVIRQTEEEQEGNLRQALTHPLA